MLKVQTASRKHHACSEVSDVPERPVVEGSGEGDLMRKHNRTVWGKDPRDCIPIRFVSDSINDRRRTARTEAGGTARDHHPFSDCHLGAICVFTNLGQRD